MGSSGLPPQEVPVMTANKHKLSFSLLLNLPLWGELGTQHVVESGLDQKGSLVSWSKPACVCSGVCSRQA